MGGDGEGKGREDDIILECDIKRYYVAECSNVGGQLFHLDFELYYFRLPWLLGLLKTNLMLF